MRPSLVLPLLLAVYSTSNAVPILENDDEHQYPRFIKFPDSDGNEQIIDLEAEPDLDALNDIVRNPERNQYLLFTRRQPHLAQPLNIDDVDSIRQSDFNPNLSTVVISHGWLSHQETDINPIIRNAFLAKGEVNIIVLDWRRLAIMDYVTAARGVPAVGRGLGQFLIFLNAVTGAPFESMHLIGFSLGAHLVGNAGREVGGKIARITGLDPAGPLWSYNRDRLNPSDAIYVEAMHTDGGYTVGGLGIGKPVAQADFFPNGGISQPGCLTNVCNHNRAWALYAASVSYNHFVATECQSNLQITFNSCRGRILHMGNDDLNKQGLGMYRVDTGKYYPY